RDWVEIKKIKNYRDYITTFGKIRTSKDIRPILFDAEVPLLYIWSFDDKPMTQVKARHICSVVERLYQLGRGVDMAWARAEILADDEAKVCLAAHGGVVHQASDDIVGMTVAVPTNGSLKSLINRYQKMRVRFQEQDVKTTRKATTGQVFTQPPKP